MGRTGFLILIFPLLIVLHAIAMSEGADNTSEKNLSYGFSPDRARWNNYATDPDDTIYFYDTKSIVRGRNKVKVWVKFGEPVNDNGVPRSYKEVTGLKEIDCGVRLIRFIEWNYISPNGDFKKYTSPTKWENVDPETADDALLEFVCTPTDKRKKR